MNTINSQWIRAEWFGNPSLQMESAYKVFSNPFNGRGTKVWVFGNGNEDCYKNKFDFCVNAGSGSDYSYTGYCVDCKTFEQAMEYVEQYHKNKKLFR